MPFDSTTQTIDAPPAPARPKRLRGRALHQHRREQAAALWRTVPAEQFDIRTWYDDRSFYKPSCGTVACARGWLVQRRHDGWRPHMPVLQVPQRGNLIAFDAAAKYFGLSTDNATACFNSSACTIHGRTRPRDVAPNDVAATLLRLPYTSR